MQKHIAKILPVVTAGVLSIGMALPGMTVMATEYGTPDANAESISDADISAMLGDLFPESPEVNEAVEGLMDVMAQSYEEPEEEIIEEDALADEALAEEDMMMEEEREVIGDMSFVIPENWVSLPGSETSTVLMADDMQQIIYVSVEEAENEDGSIAPDALAEKAVELLNKKMGDELEAEPEILEEPVTIQGMYMRAVKADETYCLLGTKDNVVYMIIYSGIADNMDDFEEFLMNIEFIPEIPADEADMAEADMNEEDAELITDLTALFGEEMIEEAVDEAVEEAVDEAIEDEATETVEGEVLADAQLPADEEIPEEGSEW